MYIYIHVNRCITTMLGSSVGTNQPPWVSAANLFCKCDFRVQAPSLVKHMFQPRVLDPETPALVIKSTAMQQELILETPVPTVASSHRT